METKDNKTVENSNDFYTLLATADDVIKQLDFILENCALSKKNEFNGSFNINDLRPKILKKRDEYVRLRNSCC